MTSKEVLDEAPPDRAHASGVARVRGHESWNEVVRACRVPVGQWLVEGGDRLSSVDWQSSTMSSGTMRCATSGVAGRLHLACDRVGAAGDVRGISAKAGPPTSNIGLGILGCRSDASPRRLRTPRARGFIARVKVVDLRRPRGS